MKFRKEKVSRAGHNHRARRFLKEACEKCGAKEKLQVHHRDRDWRNDNESNIQTLCAGCHMRLHHEAGDISANDTGFRYHGARCRFCDDPAKKRGMCDMHYLRITRTGSAEILAPEKRPCGAPGCDRNALRGGLCDMHYLRVRRHGSLDKKPTREKPFERCQICGEDAKIKGFCNKHYLRWRRHGDPRAGGKERPRK